MNDLSDEIYINIKITTTKVKQDKNNKWETD